MMNNLPKIYRLLARKRNYFLLLVMMLFFDCSSFLDADVPDQLLEEEFVFKSDDEATSAVMGLYLSLYLDNRFVSTYQSIATGVMADEYEYTPYSAFTYFIGGDFPLNQVKEDNAAVLSLWKSYYKLIYGANRVIENLTDNYALTPSLKDQLLGEALFMRAFAHFYLINYFGDVPLITTTAVEETSIAPRTPTLEIYEQIKLDLDEAIGFLAEDYSYSEGEKTRVNKWAATAFLAKVSMYTEDWTNAEMLSTQVIDQSYTLTSLDQTFLPNNDEAIFQIDTNISSDEYGYTQEASYFVTYYSNGTLTEPFVYSFEAGDARFDNWVGYGADYYGNQLFYPYKYKIESSSSASAYNQEYYTVLRLAEQYLIRAESRAKLGDLSGAIADLNVIRSRASLGNYSGSLDETEVLLAIEKERKMELFCEWGNRWFDLIRTNRAETVLGEAKDTWNSDSKLYLPIPQDAITKNPYLAN